MINEAFLLDQTLKDSGIPIVGVSGPPWRVDYQPEVTPEQRVQGAAIVAGFNPKEPHKLQRRKDAKALLADPSPEGVLRRGLIRTLGQQFNPPKTLEQLRALIVPDIDAGNCDE